MIDQGTYTDFRLSNPMIDEFDGTYFIYSEDNPDKKYEVVSLLDGSGDPVEDIEIAAGGVFKLHDQSFMVFQL